MRINEITSTDSRDEPLSRVQDYFSYKTSQLIPQTDYPNLELRASHSSDEYYIGLFDTKQSTQVPGLPDLVSVMQVYRDESHWRIVMTMTDPAFRGRKLMKALLDRVVSILGPVTSDNNQTPEAKAFWKSVIAKPGQVTVSALDLESGRKYPLTGPNSVDPWNDTEHIVILAEHYRSRYTKQMTEKFERMDHIRAKARTINWYGPDADPNNL